MGAGHALLGAENALLGGNPNPLDGKHAGRDAISGTNVFVENSSFASPIAVR